MNPGVMFSVQTILLFTAIGDLRRGRISQYAVYALFLAGLINHQNTELPWTAPALFFTIHFCGWLFERYAPGKIGWGDIKLIAVLALVLSLRDWYLLFCLALLAALVFAALLRGKAGSFPRALPLAPFLFLASLMLPVLFY